MTNKRPVAIDHTHEPATKDYNGFFSASDKALMDSVRAGAYLTTVNHDTSLSGDGTALSPLSVAAVPIPSTLSTDRIRAVATDDASLSSTLHPFQVGSTTGQNIIADGNEIMARNNGVANSINFNFDGGDVTFLGNRSYANGEHPKAFGHMLVEKGGTALGSGYWTKFYDGTMIQWFTVTVTLAITTADASAGGFTQPSANTLNLPLNFVNTNYSVIISGDAGCIGGRVVSKAVGSLTYLLRTIASSASASRTFEVQLIGRWY